MTGFSEVSKERIRTLKMLRSQSIHPIILSGIAKFDQREMERLLWLLEVLIVRYQLIGGGRTGLLEIASARLASDIYQRKILTATDAYKGFRDIFPNDAEFRESFALKQERNNTKAQYILRNIEIEARKRRLEGMAGTELGPKALTVEHIFPVSPGPEWEELQSRDPAFAEECTFRLGNMTLLSGINKELGRIGFTDKRKVYQKSSLLLTKEVAQYDNWNREGVEKRQHEMAALAIASWRFK